MGADHSVLRLLQISQQHIESQLERVIWQNALQQYAEPNKGSALYVCNCAVALTRPAGLGRTGNRHLVSNLCAWRGGQDAPQKRLTRSDLTLAGVRISDRHPMY